MKNPKKIRPEVECSTIRLYGCLMKLSLHHNQFDDERFDFGLKPLIGTLVVPGVTVISVYELEVS